MNNANYFYGSTAKPNIQGEVKQFSADDSKPELLLAHYEELRQNISKEDRRKVIIPMYKRWIAQMFAGYNVALRGPLSKYRILETYRAYLESGKLRDLKSSEAKRMANIIVVRMHGLDPNSLESFNNAVFGIVESNRNATLKDMQEFVSKAQKSRTHYVFMIHSYELYHRQVKPVCDIILTLHEMDRNFMHMVISMDHINGAKLINRLEHNFMFDELGVEHLESFQFEKVATINIIEDKVDKSLHQDTLIHGRMDLQSLIDIHQAVPEACRKIMIYIMKDFLEKKECRLPGDYTEETGEGEDFNPIERRKTRSRPSEAAPRKKSRHPPPTDLEFDRLLDYATANMIVRRQAILKNHLGEMVDHRVIEYDEASNKIQCLVKMGTCKKFLEQVESED